MKTTKFIVTNEKNKPDNPMEAIFPILKQLNKDEWQLIGTGFYILSQGIFLTAKHVLDDVINNDKQTHPIAAFHFFDDNKYIIRPILYAFRKQNSDVAAGLAAEIKHKTTGDILKNKILILSRAKAEPGELIHTYAYPETICTLKHIIFKPNYYEGKIIEHFPQGRDSVMMPHACYQTDMQLLGGSSGGPVFNSIGWVIGINGTYLTQVSSSSHISFVSDINEVLNIIINKIDIPPNHNKSYSIEQLAQMGLIEIK